MICNFRSFTVVAFCWSTLAIFPTTRHRFRWVLLMHRMLALVLDTISAPNRFTFLKGTPSNYHEYFARDESTGVLKHIKTFDTKVASEFEIIDEAEESTELKRFTTTKITIKVK